MADSVLYDSIEDKGSVSYNKHNGKGTSLNYGKNLIASRQIPTFDGTQRGTTNISFPGDFEIEAEFATTYTALAHAILGGNDGATSHQRISVSTGGVIQIRMNNQIITGVISIADGKIHTVKVTQNSGTLSLFVDDVADGTIAATPLATLDITNIGCLYDLTQDFVGEILSVKFTDAGTVVANYVFDSGSDLYQLPRGAGTLGDDVITNGAFSNGFTGWLEEAGANTTVVSGQLNAPRATVKYFYQTVPTVAGKTFIVTGDIPQGSFYCGAFDTAITNSVLSGSANTRSGAFSFTFVANDTDATLSFTSNHASLDGILDNVTIKEYPYGEGVGDEIWDDMSTPDATHANLTYTFLNGAATLKDIVGGTAYPPVTFLDFLPNGTGKAFEVTVTIDCTNSVSRGFLALGNGTDSARTRLTGVAGTEVTLSKVLYADSSANVTLYIDANPSTLNDEVVFKNVSIKQLPDSTCILTNFATTDWNRYTLQRNILHNSGLITEAWIGDNLYDGSGLTAVAGNATDLGGGVVDVNGAPPTTWAYGNIVEIGKLYITEVSITNYVEGETDVTYDGISSPETIKAGNTSFIYKGAATNPSAAFKAVGVNCDYHFKMTAVKQLLEIA